LFAELTDAEVTEMEQVVRQKGLGDGTAPM
jgi:hypothetical protein